MKIELSTKELKAALTLAKRAAPTRPVLPILGYARLVAEGNTVTITASDLEVAFHQQLNTGESETGVMTIPVKTTLDQLGKEPLTTLTVKEGSVYMQSGNLVSNLGINMPDEFPPLTIPETWDHELVVPVERLKAGLQYVLPAVCKHDTRPVLTGINWNCGKLAAADGYKLAVFDLTTPEALPGGRHVNIVGRGAEQVYKALPKSGLVQIRFEERWATFTWDATTYMVTMLEGRFPDYAPIIPKNHISEMVINRPVWLAAVQQAQAATKLNAYAVQLRQDGFSWKSGNIILAPLSHGAEDFKSWVDIRFVIAALSACNDQTVRITQNGKENPFKIETKDGIYVVMPASED